MRFLGSIQNLRTTLLLRVLEALTQLSVPSEGVKSKTSRDRLKISDIQSRTMYEAEPKRRTISEVLAEEPSQYYLPTIQRDFVWDEDDIKQMIESLQSGYPIGIITVFKTDIEFPAIPLVDPASTEDKQENGMRKYVLDGQQRLTSLFLIKNGWKVIRDGETIERTPIYFNPDDRTLRIKGKRPLGYDFSELIKMVTFATPAKPHLQKTLESLNTSFLNRPVAFYEVEVRKGARSTDQIYRDMSEIFIRINRSGIRLGNLEMFLSFFASASVGKEDIVKLHKEMNSKFGMDLEPLIRFIFSNLGLSQSQITKTDSFKRAVEDIKDKYDDAKIHEVTKTCRTCIETSMQLLRQELGISTTQILPAETVLVPLAQSLYRRVRSQALNMSQQEKDQMMKWFILASFNGLYSSHTNTKLESDLQIVGPSQGVFPLPEMLDSMKEKIKTTEISKKDFVNIDTNILRGSAGKRYLFLTYVMLCRNNATDWSGRLLAERAFNDLNRHHIFPKDELRASIDDEVLINHIGNLTFIDRSLNDALQEDLPEDYLPNFDEDVLRKHFIPPDRKLWKLDNYEQFLDERTESLWQGVERLISRPA